MGKLIPDNALIYRNLMPAWGFKMRGDSLPGETLDRGLAGIPGFNHRERRVDAGIPGFTHRKRRLMQGEFHPQRKEIGCRESFTHRERRVDAGRVLPIEKGDWMQGESYR